jgi:pyruvate/2-oxoglutarate dehydrogenase complex dihydrolipoamide dehydrogenase (E3) component
VKQFDYDAVILGGGSAGYAAARTAVGAGLKTAVIEGGGEVGGLCILHGCMPTKALLYAAEVMHLAGHARPWGIRAGKAGFDFKKVMARKNALIQDFADYRRQQLANGKFKFIRAQVRFLDAHTLKLTPHPSFGPLPAKRGEGRGVGRSQRITAKNFIITTGSVVAPPPLTQLRETGYITSDDALTLTRLPKSLIVLGGGPMACEFAQFFARFGVKVTLIQRSEHVLREFDTDAAVEIEKIFRREGIEVFTNTKLTGIKRDRQVKTVSFQHQGEIAANNIANPNEPRRMDYRLLIAVVFTEPQVAFVGLTEKEAKARGISFLAASYPFNDHGKSLIMEAKDGFVKLLADPKSGEILGGACVGPVGGELIHEIVMVMAKRMTVHELAATPHYHPTLAEIWTYPAEELAAQIS